MAAPSPVESPQANGAACVAGASGLTTARAISGITAYSAKVDVPMKWRISSPSRLRRVVPSGRWPLFCSSRIAMQRLVLGLTQWMHSPHWGENSVTTRSPSFTSDTPVAQLLHDPAALVAEHRGRVARRVRAGRGVHVRVADPAGLEANQHLARLRLGQVHLLDRERLAELLQYRRSHPHGA